MIDDTPRPRASQDVAARKRQRLTDDPPTPAVQAHAPISAGILIVAAVLLIGALSYGMSRTTSNTPLQITPGPSTAAFLSDPTAAPAPSSAPTAAPRTIPAYAAPDGALLGPIDMTTEQAFPVARYGNVWVQLQRADQTKIWVRLGDVFVERQSFATLPDLAPAPQTGKGLTIDTSGSPDKWTPPDPTVAPAAPPTEPTATPAVWVTSAPATAPDFAKPDIKGTCQFTGCLGQQAVDLARAQACHALYWQYGDADAETISEPDLSAVRGCIWEGLYR
jgi:hypothetical protein